MNELPTAVVTVRFNQSPISGEQIAALVQQVAGGGDSQAHYVEKTSYYDGDVVSCGQTSKYPYDHIRVTPALDGPPCFRFEEFYSEIKVVSCSWGGSVYAIGYEQGMVINAVKAFAAKLADAYEASLTSGFPSYTKPKDDHTEW